MALTFIWSLNRWQRGFFSVCLMYALGLGGSVLLAQFMPVADMCNPGLPFGTALITVGLGIIAAALTFIAYIIQTYVIRFRRQFIEGMLLAHMMVLVPLCIGFLCLLHQAA